MARICNIKTVDIGRTVQGRNYAKGDYIPMERNYVFQTEEGRQFGVAREVIVNLLIEVIGKPILRLTASRLAKLVGMEFDESLAEEEGPRLFTPKEKK